MQRLSRSGAPAIRLNYQDYALLPNDGKRYEILQGDLHMAPAPGSGHQILQINLAVMLKARMDRKKAGLVLVAPTDVLMGEHDIVQPDLLFVRTDRLGIVTKRGIEGAPDLAVEIVSPGREDFDRRAKLRAYERLAVPHYWIADPRTREIAEHVRHRGRFRLRRVWKARDTMRPALLPGLALPLSRLWPPAELV